MFQFLLYPIHYSVSFKVAINMSYKHRLPEAKAKRNRNKKKNYVSGKKGSQSEEQGLPKGKNESITWNEKSLQPASLINDFNEASSQRSIKAFFSPIVDAEQHYEKQQHPPTLQAASLHRLPMHTAGNIVPSPSPTLQAASLHRLLMHTAGNIVPTPSPTLQAASLHRLPMHTEVDMNSHLLHPKLLTLQTAGYSRPPMYTEVGTPSKAVPSTGPTLQAASLSGQPMYTEAEMQLNLIPSPLPTLQAASLSGQLMYTEESSNLKQAPLPSPTLHTAGYSKLPLHTAGNIQSKTKPQQEILHAASLSRLQLQRNASETSNSFSQKLINIGSEEREIRTNNSATEITTEDDSSLQRKRKHSTVGIDSDITSIPVYGLEDNVISPEEVKVGFLKQTLGKFISVSE